MKTRSQFISNSSSSSFIITGEKVSFEDAKNFEDCVWFTEKELSDGEDYIELTPKIIKTLEEQSQKGNLNISFSDGIILKNTKWYEKYDNEYIITPEDLHKCILNKEIDQHSTRNDLKYNSYRYFIEDCENGD